MAETLNLGSERLFVEGLAANYITSDDSSQLRLMRRLEVEVFQRYLAGGKALELGCEIGYMSELIAPVVDQLDIVDASHSFLEQVKRRAIPNARYFCSLFEEFQPDCQYDAVFASHVLEHLFDVQRVLSLVTESLTATGRFFVAVPNARAMSRQLARHMGIIDSLYELTENDLRGGHRRVYDHMTLRRELEAAGLEIITQGGIFFKPFADFQLDQLLDMGFLGDAQIEGLRKLGDEYPDMCADIYAVCRKKSP